MWLSSLRPIQNLLRRLCAPFNERQTIRVATFAHFRTTPTPQQFDLSAGGSSSGNKIGVFASQKVRIPFRRSRSAFLSLKFTPEEVLLKIGITIIISALGFQHPISLT
jgi:hypothetical protein